MLTIDTLELSEDLKKGGFDENQTATLVDLGRKLSAQALEKVATKDDLKALKDDLKDDVKALEERIDGKLEMLEGRIDSKFDGVSKDMLALEERMDVKFDGLQKETKADLTVCDREAPDRDVQGAGRADTCTSWPWFRAFQVIRLTVPKQFPPSLPPSGRHFFCLAVQVAMF